MRTPCVGKHVGYKNTGATAERCTACGTYAKPSNFADAPPPRAPKTCRICYKLAPYREVYTDGGIAFITKRHTDERGRMWCDGEGLAPLADYVGSV